MIRIQASSRLRPFALLIAITLTTLATSAPSRAQSDSPIGKRLLTNTDIVLLGGWTSDERYLGVVLNPMTFEFKHFDVSTGQFVLLPPTEQLTTTELSIFGIDVNDPYPPHHEYFISPDGTYVAYNVPAGPDHPRDLADSDECAPRQLRLANRRTKLTVDLPFVEKLPVVFGWNIDSRGFTVALDDGCGGPGTGIFAYFSNLSPALAELRITKLEDIAQLQVDNGQIQLLSTSRDGLWLLAAVLPYYNGQGSRLVLVDVVNPTQSTIIADNIDGFLTAKLIAETPATLLMVSAAGLTELSLTGQQTVLDSRLKTTGVTYDCSAENYVKDASISPSGRWLAYTHCDPYLGETSLYLLDLHALRHPNSPPLTISPTFTPVGY